MRKRDPSNSSTNYKKQHAIYCREFLLTNKLQVKLHEKPLLDC